MNSFLPSSSLPPFLITQGRHSPTFAVPSPQHHAMHAPEIKPPLLSLKEVHIRKFLHLLDIGGLDHFLVIEKDPLRSALAGKKLAYERYVMTVFC